MAIQKTQAVVLKRLPVRETSRLLTIYTEDFGKIRVIAKGVRSGSSDRSSHFEIFNWLDVVFYEKKRGDIFLLTETGIINFFAKIREDMELTGWASYLAELTDVAVELGEPNPELFQMLVDTLSNLELKGRDPRLIVRVFETKLLHMMGYLPEFEHCTVCGASFKRAFFVFRDGILVCERCRRSSMRGRPVSAGARKALSFILHHPLEQAWRLKDSGSVLNETTSIIRYLLTMRCEHKFRTLHYLEEITF